MKKLGTALLPLSIIVLAALTLTGCMTGWVHIDATLPLRHAAVARPAPPCQWVWISSYWETGWICVPTPGVHRVTPTVPPAVRRPRTSPPAVAVPRPPAGRGRGSDAPTPPAGRGGRGGRGQVDDRAWLGACDSPDPCPPPRRSGREK